MRHIVSAHRLILRQSHRLNVDIVLSDATLAPVAATAGVRRGRVVFEDFLSVGSDLRTDPGAHMLRNFLPVLTVYPNRCSHDIKG